MPVSAIVLRRVLTFAEALLIGSAYPFRLQMLHILFDVRVNSFTVSRYVNMMSLYSEYSSDGVHTKSLTSPLM